MDYGDYSWGLYRDYYRDPFPHSLLSTRQQIPNEEPYGESLKLVQDLVGK